MATADDIGKEKQRLAERLARIEVEREKVAAQLNELEVAERVLSRFGGAERGARRRRPGRPARPAAAAAEKPKPAPRRARGRGRAAAARQTPSISDAVLKAVHAHPEGIAAGDVLKQLTGEGLAVRPNHLGIALQRHRRAGRLDQRDQRWFPPAGA